MFKFLKNMFRKNRELNVETLCEKISENLTQIKRSGLRPNMGHLSGVVNRIGNHGLHLRRLDEEQLEQLESELFALYRETQEILGGL